MATDSRPCGREGVMKITTKWLFGTLVRVVLMGPLMGIKTGCEKAVRWLDRRLPGG